MKKLILMFIFICQVTFADELWVFYHHSCHHCELFINKTYTFYPNKKVWKIKAPVPLIRLIELSEPGVNDMIAQTDSTSMNYTPTFVLMDDENGYKEIGRFSGYDTEENFYSNLTSVVCKNTKYIKCDTDKMI